MSRHVELLTNIIVAETAWRDEIVDKKRMGFVGIIGGVSLEKLIAQAGNRVHDLHAIIDSLTHQEGEDY
jgi:hypothetical protein